MKKTVRRVLILTLLLAISASFFSGCRQAEKTSTTASDTADKDVKIAGSEKPVTLKFATFISSRDASGNNVEENVTKEFTSKFPNINVELQMITDNNAEEYVKKTDLMLAGGDDIDVLVYPRLDWCAERVGRGMLAPLDEYIAADGKKFSDMFTVNTEINGKIYALPNDATINFVLINKNYLDEAGLPIPKADWTWDDYRDYARQLTKGEGKDKRYGSYKRTVLFWLFLRTIS